MSTVNKILARIEETKSITRRVRTPAGAKKYGQPIGSIIVPDPIPDAPRRKKAKRSATTPKISMAPNKPQVVRTEVRVAPPQSSIGDNEEPRTPVDKPSKIRLVKSHAPLMERFDWEFLRTGSAEEARRRLEDLGVDLYLDEEFSTNHSFMVALSEVLRGLEEEFPGFVYRHGNIGSDMNLSPETYAYNTQVARKKRSERIAPESIRLSKDNGSSYRRAEGAPGVWFVPARDQTQTMTIVGPGLLREAGTIPFSHGIGYTIGKYSSNDGMSRVAKEVGPEIAGMIDVLTHEFGHAVTYAINGHTSFELDGQKDKDQAKRRWYAEYYMDAFLEFMDSLGAIKRTDMEIDSTLLKPLMESRSAIGGPEGNRVKIDLDSYSDEPFPKDVERRIDQVAGQIMMDDSPSTEELRELERLLKIVSAWKERNVKPLIARTLLNQQLRLKPYEEYLKELVKDGYAEGEVDPKAILGKVSQYANTSWGEAEAEIWTSYMLDTEVTEVTARWGAVMDEMFSWWNAEDTTNGQEG